MKACVVLTTVGADFEVQPLALALVEQRLAACVNIVPVRSIYRWKEGVELEGEQLLLIKTTTNRLAALEEALLTRHPYEVPELVVLPAEAHGSYAEWLVESVSLHST